MATNDITGDRIASKIPSKAYAENYDHIEKTWRKHDGSKIAPVPAHQLVKIETAILHSAPKGNHTYYARDINWLAVKWYALVDAV